MFQPIKQTAFGKNMHLWPPALGRSTPSQATSWYQPPLETGHQRVRLFWQHL